MRAAHGPNACVLPYFLYSDATVVQTIGRDVSYHRVIAYVAGRSITSSRARYGYVTIGWLPTFVVKKLGFTKEQLKTCALQHACQSSGSSWIAANPRQQSLLPTWPSAPPAFKIACQRQPHCKCP